VREQLALLPDESVHVVVTSPPYYRQRAYSMCPCQQLLASEVTSSGLAGGGNAHLPNHTQSKAPRSDCPDCNGTGKLPGMESRIYGGREDCAHDWNIQIIKDRRGAEGSGLEGAFQEEALRFDYEIAVCASCGAYKGELGLEPTPELFVRDVVEVFRGLRRVLRDDGVLFVNMGDSMHTDSPVRGSTTEAFADEWDESQTASRGGLRKSAARVGDLKNKDEIGVPDLLWRAMLSDGWYKRSTIIWAKGASFGPYVGNVMPSPDSGWRWENHRVLVPVSGKKKKRELAPCPGCPRCAPNGGLVLRKQAWKPTRTHEFVFMFTKAGTYFCDRDAVAEPYVNADDWGRLRTGLKGFTTPDPDNDRADPQTGYNAQFDPENPEPEPGAGRNLRSVWTIPPRGYSGSHYATFPEALVEPCINVATSERGVCATCGSQHARILERKTYGSWREHQGDLAEGNATAPELMLKGQDYYENYEPPQTVGWKKTCTCPTDETAPAVVLDPFAGSGTTLAVAYRLGRRSIGIELSPVSVRLAAERVGDVAAPSHSLARWL